MHLGLQAEADGLLVFEIPSINHSDSWGSAWSKWVDVWEPETSVAIFSAEAGKASFEIIYNQQVVHRENIELNKGVNYIVYDMTIDPDAVELFNQTKEEEEEKPGSAVADNERFYLPIGNYSAIITKKGVTHSTPLKIE